MISAASSNKKKACVTVRRDNEVVSTIRLLKFLVLPTQKGKWGRSSMIVE